MEAPRAPEEILASLCWLPEQTTFVQKLFKGPDPKHLDSESVWQNGGDFCPYWLVLFCFLILYYINKVELGQVLCKLCFYLVLA